VSGHPNKVLSVGAKAVIVGTTRSPDGTPVPIEWVQDAMDMLEQDGEVRVNVDTLGFRSAFVGAVLATLPGASVSPSPTRISLSRDEPIESPSLELGRIYNRQQEIHGLYGGQRYGGISTPTAHRLVIMAMGDPRPSQGGIRAPRCRALHAEPGRSGRPVAPSGAGRHRRPAMRGADDHPR